MHSPRAQQAGVSVAYQKQADYILKHGDNSVHHTMKRGILLWVEDTRLPHKGQPPHRVRMRVGLDTPCAQAKAFHRVFTAETTPRR